MQPSRNHHDTITPAQDPFYLVKEELQSLVNSIESRFRKWNLIPIGSTERAQHGKELTRDCSSIDWQVDELDKAIAVAERDPAKYGIDTAELAQRKRWTAATRSQISAIKKSMEAATTKVELMRMPGNPLNQKASSSISQEDEEFYASENDRQALIIKEQDQDLDELSATVERLGGVGLTIHDELISQERIIEDLGQEMDNTKNRLDFVQKKVAHVIKKAGAKGQIMMIVFLVILLLVLVLLVFS